VRIRSFEKGSYRVAKGDQIGGAIRNKDQAHDCKLENIEGYNDCHEVKRYLQSTLLADFAREGMRNMG
jgi:hypothetical protein|tara:strand:- start:20348 stop:20551 length:204 start_codon:yes stop_codon:yes gene_type:complete